MASTTSGRARATAPPTPARAVKPPKARARAGMLRLSVGNGCTRVMRPHVGVLVADQAAVPARLDGVVLVPGQRGDDVQPVAPRPRAPRRSAVMTSPVGATSGAKCGQRTSEVHGRSERVRTVGGQQPTLGGRRRASAPRTRAGRTPRCGPPAAGARARGSSRSRRMAAAHAADVVGRRRAAPASPTTSGRAVASAATHRAARGHGLEHGQRRSPRSATGTASAGGAARSSASRSRPGMRPGRADPVAERRGAADRPRRPRPRLGRRRR